MTTFAGIYTFYYYYRQLPSSKRFLVTEILLFNIQLNFNETKFLYNKHFI